MQKFFVDGNSTERINGYCVWRVMDEKENILASMHGPMSLKAALSFCKLLREDSTPSVTDRSFFK